MKDKGVGIQVVAGVSTGQAFSEREYCGLGKLPRKLGHTRTHFVIIVRISPQFEDDQMKKSSAVEYHGLNVVRRHAILNWDCSGLKQRRHERLDVRGL